MNDTALAIPSPEDRSDPKPKPLGRKSLRRRLLKFGAIIGVLLIAVSAVGDLTSTVRSGLYERKADGSFSVTAGVPSRSLAFALEYSNEAIDTAWTRHNAPQSRHPLRLSSLTILDVSGTEVSGRVAQRIARNAMQLEELERVDVRIDGDPLDVDRIGELLLVIEEVACERPAWWFGNWQVHYNVWLGHTPPFGWGDRRETISPLVCDWNIDAQIRAVCSPLHQRVSVAESVGDAVDLADAIEHVKETWSATASPPEEVLPSAIDMGGAADVVAATGITDDPLLRGIRIGRKGDALWRYVGSDTCDRIDAAVATLKAAGWTRLPGGSSGVDGRTHNVALRRGNEVAEWTFEENRIGRLQQHWTSSALLPDGSWGESESHVEGDARLPAVWLHYWHEQSNEELEQSLARAEALGGDAAERFLAALPTHQREALEGETSADDDAHERASTREEQGPR